MKLNEILYREIATEFLNGNNKFTQKGLSEWLGISIGNVNASIKRIEGINAVQLDKKSFRVIAFDKLMMYWATHRRLDNDIVYMAHSLLSVKEVEESMPNGILFTAYSAYKKIYHTAPADYGEVFVYATETSLEEIKRRFHKQGKFPNIFVLKADKALSNVIVRTKDECVPIPNVFVDLWNIKTWYAKEFVDALSKKLFE